MMMNEDCVHNDINVNESWFELVAESGVRRTKGKRSNNKRRGASLLAIPPSLLSYEPLASPTLTQPLSNSNLSNYSPLQL